VGRMIRGLLGLAMLLGACGSESSTSVSENPLGVLVECDDVVEEVVGYNSEGDVVERRKVARVSVENPLSARVTRCDFYHAFDGEVVRSGSGCYVEEATTLTPELDVVVECAKDIDSPGREVETYGYERVYLRTSEPEGGAAPPNGSPLGVPVRCNQSFVDAFERTAAGVVYDIVERRDVAYVPVEDPSSVVITRCGEHRIVNGETRWSRTDCVASTEVEFTADSRVFIECQAKTTNLDTGTVALYGYEQLYIHESPSPVDQPAGLGVLVECDQLREWEFDPGTVHATQHRSSFAHLPVADPTSVTITRCGEYTIENAESTYSDACVSSKGVGFTEDFEVYVRCHEERTGWLADTTGYQRIYYRAD